MSDSAAIVWLIAQALVNEFSAQPIPDAAATWDQIATLAQHTQDTAQLAQRVDDIRQASQEDGLASKFLYVRLLSSRSCVRCCTASPRGAGAT